MRSGASLHVLLLAEGEAMRAALEGLIASFGHRAVSEGGAVALLASEASAQAQPDRLRALRRRDPLLPVITLSAPGDSGGAMLLLGEGAYDCLPWPVDEARLGLALHRAAEWRRLALENQSLRQGAPRPPAREALLTGTSAAMMDVYRVITQVAPTSAPVLILGDEGTGKGLVAKAIHERSGRPGAFVSARCLGASDVDFGRELFGDDDRPGLIEDAHGGTLFLDDIDALGARSQAQLLRVIEERAVRRGGRARAVDVRMVTATRSDLSAESADGRFREDLLFRLHVVTVQVPPLSARREDIPALIECFAQHYAMVLGRPTPTLSAEAREALTQHPWPGNVRQLARTIERAVLKARGDVIVRDDLEAAGPNPAGQSADAGGAEPWPTLASMERRYIDQVLGFTRGNKTRAAEVLGIDRRTLSRLFARERAEQAPGARGPVNR